MSTPSQGLAKYQSFIKEKKEKGMSHKEALEAWRQINPKKVPAKKKLQKEETSEEEEIIDKKKPIKKVIKYYQ